MSALLLVGWVGAHDTKGLGIRKGRSWAGLQGRHVPRQIGRGTPSVAVDGLFVSGKRSIRSTAIAGSYWTNQFHGVGLADFVVA